MDNIDSYGQERGERKLRVEERRLGFERWAWEMEERVDELVGGSMQRSLDG